MEHVIIGVDPHKLSAAIEVVDHHERRLGSGRFSTDQAGYAAMRAYVKAWPQRVWAVEGANGAGRPLAQRRAWSTPRQARFRDWVGRTSIASGPSSKRRWKFSSI